MAEDLTPFKRNKYLMAPSTTSTSISTFLTSHGTLLDLEPRRQTNADLKSANEVLVLIHEMVLAIITMMIIMIIIILMMNNDLDSEKITIIKLLAEDSRVQIYMQYASYDESF